MRERRTGVRPHVLAASLATLGFAAPSSAGEVPVDLGVGPAAYVIPGPVRGADPFETGLKISLQAVLDREFIRQHRDEIPARYRDLASDMDEVRTSPSIFIPDALIVSPEVAGRHAGLYGATWRPLSLGLPFGGAGVRFDLEAGLLLTYLFVSGDALPTTHFIRPGLDLAAELEIPVSRSFLVGFGWSSGFYVPQKLGGFGLGARGESIWYLGQGFLKLHFRFPYALAE